MKLKSSQLQKLVGEGDRFLTDRNGVFLSSTKSSRIKFYTKIIERDEKDGFDYSVWEKSFKKRIKDDGIKTYLINLDLAQMSNFIVDDCLEDAPFWAIKLFAMEYIAQRGKD